MVCFPKVVVFRKEVGLEISWFSERKRLQMQTLKLNSIHVFT